MNAGLGMRPPRSVARPRFVHWALFWWVPLAAMLFAIYLMWGVPHVLWSWRYIDNDGRYKPFKAFTENLTFTSCDYVWFVPSNGVRVRPTNGRCAWFRFERLPSKQE